MKLSRTNHITTWQQQVNEKIAVPVTYSDFFDFSGPKAKCKDALDFNFCLIHCDI